MSLYNRSFRFILVAVLLVPLISLVFQSQNAYATQITNRSLTLQAGATDGGSKPSGVVKHLFTFTLPNVGAVNVGSIQFKYCQIASGVCDMPTGLLTTSATLSNETGATGFTMVNTTNGTPYITRAASAIPAGTTATYQFSTVTNPSTVSQAFFVRISTFASIDTSGSPIDTGTVTATTTQQIVLTGEMPESLIFCTGAIVPLNGSIPDCGNATSGIISFNQLFSPTDTATAKSQMAASTNALNGFTISVFGPTMTSGSNTIPAMSVAAASIKGIGQFGMNLRANTLAASNPIVGADITPSPDGPTHYLGQPAVGYETIDSFKFVAGTVGDTVANSAFGGTPGPTNAQVYTSSYIVNVTGSQLAGTYITTLTYICTPTF